MNFKFSCVVDNKPIFKAQAYIFINSLLELADIKPQDIYVHTTKKEKDDFYDWLDNKKVNVIEICAFDERNPYCNKLKQLATFQDMDDFDYVFLLDCDIAVVSLEGLNLEADIYSKVVDFPNPSYEVLQNIFNAAKVTSLKQVTVNFAQNEKDLTDANNANGGVYIISNKIIKPLAKEWIDFANWSLDHIELYTANYAKHVDQVSFALALNKLGIESNNLDIKWNFPTHVKKDLLPDIHPNIIHFHSSINEHMQLKKVDLKNVDEQIEKVNEVISKKLANSLNNSLFWDLRYVLYPELGSGVGSRGDVLNYKKNIIKYATYKYLDKKIIDVGCGDLELTRDFNFKNYLGLDVSQEALRIAKSKKPDLDFLNANITSNAITDADLIMCFDVLIHQSKKEDFKEIVKSIVEKAHERIIIGAYNKKPQYSSDITHFYNGILDEVKSYDKFNEIGIIAEYRDVSVVVATKHQNLHKRDIPSEVLNKAFGQVNRPDLLQYLVDVSRYNFGFFTSHYPRVFEYSWLLEQLETEKKGNVLDIGAGVCPLPICLSENGLSVFTVDSHPITREKDNIADWNEWGFLDYSLFNKDIQSSNVDFLKFNGAVLFDFIYSISVIEHIPGKGRRKIIQKASKLLRKGGKLLLTIDIIPNTNNFWNLSEDKEVEPMEQHGRIDSFKKELKANGFEVVEEHVQRNIPNSRTDVYYVKAILKSENIFSKYFKK